MASAEHGLGLDLELDGRGRLRAIGAVLGSAEFRRDVTGSPDGALHALDTFAAPAEFVFGHNLYAHDLVWLRESGQRLGLLRKPAVDTLVLSTIAFAEHPYHALLKGYKLVRDAVNDPVADARIAHRLLMDAQARMRELATASPTFGRIVRSLARLGASSLGPHAAAGLDLVFAELSELSSDLDGDLRTLVGGRACRDALEALTPVSALSPDSQWALLFAVAWMRVAGTHDATSPSVVMPWVRREVPAVTALLDALRSRRCGRPECVWCRDVGDPVTQLRRWFGFSEFRPQPTLPDGRGAQRAIVEAGLSERPLLALLPTGGGKSLCFQLPAIARYLRRGCLTVVISPLQSLMHDQVDNFARKTGLPCAYALSGLLTPPERRATLDAVRNGQAGILYVSPEQLRNASFRKAVQLREIGAWVFDEAHCLSKWGHDFRPDYLYAARFVREYSEAHRLPIAATVCVTATANPAVRTEILEHFGSELGQELEEFDGHAPRENLTLLVESVLAPAKLARTRELVCGQLAAAPTGSVLVYTATRANAELVAARLREGGVDAEAFHAGLDAPFKKDVQARFLDGSCRVVCATNAFGMGIDKADIRLVVHFEIPGSLESYVQEVGRAGRDGAPAEAVMLFAEDDIETQFRLAARSRLSAWDLQGILRRVRWLSRVSRRDGAREVVCTPGEILQDDEVAERIDPADRAAATRVVTAIAWLERGKFLRRDENATTVFQGRPLVQTLAEARQRIDALGLPPNKAEAWIAVLARLIQADADEGLSSDDLLGLPAVVGAVGTVDSAAAGRAILRLLLEMQRARLLSTGVLMTAFLRQGVVDPSLAKLDLAARVESEMLAILRELEPDPEEHASYPLDLRSLVHELADREGRATLDLARSILASMADRAQHARGRDPGLYLHFVSRDHCVVRVRGSWDGIEGVSRRRHVLARVCLDVMLEALLDKSARGASLLSEFSLEQIVAALDRDLELRSQPSPDPATEIEYALLFLHRIRAIVLHKGLAVFRSAMVLRLPDASTSRKFTREDFLALEQHQEQRTMQIHVMHEFARRSLRDPKRGTELLDDYFRLAQAGFLDKWFENRRREIARSTSPSSWRRIVGNLSKAQRRIVEAGEDRSLLVLAGPGSGKTRVVVHRCAYLLRVKRVPARSVLVLCFNRSAAIELRQRLRGLVGEDARGVLIQTYHGMAARLAGRAPAERLEAGARQEDVFEEMMRAAIDQLELGSRTESEEESGDLRDRLLAGFRHILVDEYQDIDEDQYRLVSAIAGRTIQDEERKLTVLAVGDDDQNIYQWRGSNIRFLRRFEADYRARRVVLAETFRATANITAVANDLIAMNRDRLKSDTPICVDAARRALQPGGEFGRLDDLCNGRVHVLELVGAEDQADAARSELRRLSGCDPGLAWGRCAVLSPRHALLDPVRAALEQDGIPVCFRIGRDQSHSLFRIREVQEFLSVVDSLDGETVSGPALRDVLEAQRSRRPREAALDLVDHAVAAYLGDFGEEARSKQAVRAYFGELFMEQRRERTMGSGVMLGTVHGAKGQEFDHVVLLDGGWHPRGEDTVEELRRLYYVGMTRARKTLSLMHWPDGGAPWIPALAGDAVCRSRVGSADPAPRSRIRYELLGQRDIWLAFAGLDSSHERIATAIDRLATGDALDLRPRGKRLFVFDSVGAVVGALSDDASTRWRSRLQEIRGVRVAAILRRGRRDEGQPYGDRLLRDEWHVVVPEVTTSPAATSGT